MNTNRVIYPVIIGEYHDDGDYFVVTSPNIPGLVTQGDTLADAAYWAEDAIATMIEDTKYPEVQDASEWVLKDNERIVYVSVDMGALKKEKSKTVKRSVTVPEYLNDMAKEQNINVSRVLTEALADKLKVNI